MKTNAAGREIIRKHEGYELEAYPDPESALGEELQKAASERSPNWICLPGDPWTIGIGATGPGIGPGLVWTDEQVSARFEQDLERFEKDVTDVVEVCLNENQFSALVSFTFNEGRAHLATSTLLEKLNDGNFLDAADEFLRWEYSQGRKVKGLVERRVDEQTLFLTKVTDLEVA